MPASLFSDYLWEQNMTKLSSILVVVDPTVERDFVVERAVAIAKLTNVKVTLFINHANTPMFTKASTASFLKLSRGCLNNTTAKPCAAYQPR
jgi:hypothetical protein